MGRAGRIACVTVPYLLSVASLVALIFVVLGSTRASSKTLDNLFFMRADLSNLTSTENHSVSNQLLSLASDAINGKNASAQLAAALEESEKDAELKDFYDIGLWGYCSGDKVNGDFRVTFCSDRKAGFWFNPITIWHLDTNGISDLLPDKLQNELNTYKHASYWMFFAYAVAFAATVVELIFGFTAMLSRLGSVATSVVSIILSLIHI